MFFSLWLALFYFLEVTCLVFAQYFSAALCLLLALHALVFPLDEGGLVLNDGVFLLADTWDFDADNVANFQKWEFAAAQRVSLRRARQN